MELRMRYFWVLLVLTGMVLGCAGSDRPETVPVSGTVTLNGQPLAGAHVVFTLKEGGELAKATGTTDSQGKYQLSTFGENDGAVPGSYVVTITKTAGGMEGSEEMDAEDPSELYGEAMEAAARGEEVTEGESEIPAKYGDPQQSGLEATVTKGGPNEFNFDLK
ncbi:MAG TPA: carboxypeptidase regulatory-like domain-containing protein [Planctomycetaceae bacterium]|nr:carboxypeptidase regulatory-like domain-containing protein [Planctomycetaceae bacterium]HIQ21310.1 carboxypeptidase regulatory-like domain-containing protein [Planctomycetota bacterium]